MKASVANPKIYEYTVCPFCHKIKALLEFKNIPYDRIEVNPMKKKEIAFSKDYKKVPIVIDKDGVQVNDSTPIMRHLDKQYPNRPVFETEKDKIEEEDKWLEWCDKVLVKALPPIIYDTFGHALKAFSYITKDGNFSWWQRRYIKYCGAFVMWMVAKKSAKRQNISNPQKHLENTLEEWVNALNNNQFLGGDKPNGADLAAFGILRSIKELPAFEFVKRKPVAYHWYNRVQEQIQNR